MGFNHSTKDFKIPEKADGELRPDLFPRYTTTKSLGADFASHPAHFDNEGEFLFDAAAVKDLAPQIKCYLLYCHGLCIQDGLIYLLDFFRLGRDDDPTLQPRVPAVTHLLRQYASIAPLLRHRIVIPVADEMFPWWEKEIRILDERETQEIMALVQKLDQRYVASLGSLVKEQWQFATSTGNVVDMYFPTDIYVRIFQGLLRALQHRFSSQMVLEPFDVGILGNLSNIDPNQISLEDIVQVREEAAFEDFRSFIRGAFDRLHNSEAFSDYETQFAAAFREEMADKREVIRAMTQKSSLLRQVFSDSDRILVGAALGAVPGSLAGSPAMAILGAALSGAGRPTYDIVRGLIRESPSSKTRVSLRNHFLAVHPGKSEPT